MWGGASPEEIETKEEVVSNEPSSSNEVTIGKQVWMNENLNVDRFRNGDPIPEAKTTEEWERAGVYEEPAWCYYDNDPANGEKYGKLYNWYAVSDPRGLAPTGYHVPTDAEWTTLVDHLGADAGEKMKSKSGWHSYNGLKTCPNCASWNTEYRSKVPCHTCKDTRSVYSEKSYGTNKSGFSGLPGGYRYDDGTFDLFGYDGYWWSSTEANTGYAWPRYLNYSFGNVYRYIYYKNYGISVRCLRD